MKIHILKHVPFEGPGYIGTWANSKGHGVCTSCMFEDVDMPTVDSFDLLLVLGGPMNIYEHAKFAWLEREKEFIAASIDAGKAVLGICLGAQLICDVLGGQVTKNRQSEIGWFDVERVSGVELPELWQGVLPEKFCPLHWHGDTFCVPDGAVRLAKSSACDNQAFLFSDRVLGVQFHCEADWDYVEQICGHCRNDTLKGGEFVMDAEEILASAPEKMLGVNPVMEKIMETFERICR